MNVLPEDKKLAKELIYCCYSTLNRARMELKRADQAKDIHTSEASVLEVERWIKEFHRCKRDFDLLVEKKRQRDKGMEKDETITRIY